MDTNSITVSSGLKNLSQLIEKLKNPDELKRNEAETRFHIIDTLIQECLGWPKDQIHVEIALDKKYSDYELGSPRKVIWEAKREGNIFELPVNNTKKIVMDIPSLFIINENIKKAIIQTQGYCSQRGVQIGVVCNGSQLIAFLATRFDGIPPLEGNAIVISSLKHLQSEFKNIWQLLSYEAIYELKIIRYLTTGKKSLPIKLSSKLMSYPKIRYSSQIQNTLKQLSEMLIQDVIETKEVEESFFKECYCESGAISKYSLISKNILEARYASMFNEKEPYPAVTPVKSKGNTCAFTPDVMAEAISLRPIVLIGDVGVGKTSFVKNLIYNSAFDEFKNALYIYIDLGSSASLATNLRDFVLNSIESQLLVKYKRDINDYKFIKGAYAPEIKRFSRGLYGQYKTTDPEKYEAKLIEHLEEIIKLRDQHLKKSISFISKSMRLQTIICIDNSDQRSFDIQQQAFIISQELAKSWNSTVFVSVRPHTFFKSKNTGVLAAYPHKVFTISPPRIDNVIEKRLAFVLKIAEGKIPVETLGNMNLKIDNLSIFIRTLLHSLERNKELTEFISNITGGNIRSAIEFVTSFIGSPNVDAEKIIRVVEEKNNYLIPFHEFSKSALLGDYSHYNPDTSLAMNVFDINNPNPKEHFIILLIIAYLDFENSHKDKDGFIDKSYLYEEFQSMGYSEGQIDIALMKTTNKKLIETSQRVTFDEDESGLADQLPNSYRITSIGAYHYKRWIYRFAYLDAMVFDTPIINEQVQDNLILDLESFDLRCRLKRALAFKHYLLICWSESNLSPKYFDLNQIFKQGEREFEAIGKTDMKKKRL